LRGNLMKLKRIGSRGEKFKIEFSFSIKQAK
jgi:hypothetical protein